MRPPHNITDTTKRQRTYTHKIVTFLFALTNLFFQIQTLVNPQHRQTDRQTKKVSIASHCFSAPPVLYYIRNLPPLRPHPFHSFYPSIRSPSIHPSSQSNTRATPAPTPFHKRLFDSIQFDPNSRVDRQTNKQTYGLHTSIKPRPIEKQKRNLGSSF